MMTWSRTRTALPWAFALAILIARPGAVAQADAAEAPETRAHDPVQAPSEVVQAFDGLVRFAARVCQHEPARECVDVAFDYADADGSGGVTPAEGHRVRDAAAAWLAWQEERTAADGGLTSRDRALAGFWLWLADTLGVDNLHAGYDENGDGAVTRAELLDGTDLDQRPMSEVLRDPAALDTLGVAERFGFLIPLLQDWGS